MKKKTKNFFVLAVIVLVSVLLPAFLIKAETIDEYTSGVLCLGAMNAIMAISVNLISGITGQLSLGQAGFLAIGAYASIFFTNSGIPFGVSVILAGLFTAFVGFLIGIPTLKLSGDYLAIVTLGFGEIVRVVFLNLTSITGGSNGVSFPSPVDYDPFKSYLMVILILIAIIILVQNFVRSTYGRAILAVRDDEIAANSSGVSTFKYKMIGFVMASFIAGIGGTMYAALVGFLKPDVSSFLRSIDYLIYVVLGGMGSMTGSVIAAFVLTYLQEFLRFLKDYRLVIYSVILILVMLFRPQGLLGMKELSFTKLFDSRKKIVEKVSTFFKERFTRKQGK